MAAGKRFAPFLLLLAAGRVSALDPNKSLSQYQSKIWQAEDGLPRNNVRALALRKDGQLLVATTGGSAVFDGVRFRPLPSRIGDSYSGERTQSILAARDGSIWMGLQWAGLAVRKGNAFRRITAADGLAGNGTQSLFEDESGAVWVGLQDGACRIGETIQCLADSHGGPRMWNRFADDNSGGVLIAAKPGLLRWESGKATRLQQSEPEEIHTLFRGRDRRLWAGGVHGLFRMELRPNGAGVTLTKVAGVPGPVVAMAEDHAGNLWISSFGDGLYRMNALGVEHDTSLPDQFVVSLLVDGADNLWIGLRTEGLMRRTDGEFIPYGAPEGLRSPFALAVHEDALGTLWLAAMDGGLYRFHNGKLTSEGLPAALSHFSIYALTSGPRGDLWFGNWGDGLYHLENGKLTRWNERDGTVGRYVLGLRLDSHGDLWIGSSDAGLSVLRGASGSPSAPGRLIQGESVNSLISLSPGVVLAGSNSGLSLITGDSVRRTGSWGGVESLSQDSSGRVWVGFQSGAFGLYENGSVRLVPPNAGIPRMPVYAAVDDRAGSLWLATDRGIVRVLVEQLLGAVSGSRATVDVAVYGKEDGMRSSEVRGQGRPPGLRASGGDLWFATAGSFVRRPAQSSGRVESVTPVIAGTEVDGRAVDGETSLTLEPDTRDLTVQFGAAGSANPHQVKYRYKLEGYDRDWVQDSGEGTARYGPLPRGQLRFLVQARVALGPWSTPTAVLEIVRRPHWYETWWLHALAVCSVGAMVWLAAKWYRRRLRGRVSAVLEERNRISREWHDSLMAGFAAISWQLEATSDRLRASPEDAASSLELARNMVRHTQAEARRIIWDLRLDLDESVPLSSTIEQLCERVSSVSHVPVKTRVEGPEVRLKGVVTHNLLRIAQEALQNAIKHAHPESILVWLKYESGSVSLGVKDDGCGFKNEQSGYLDGGHLGILGMNERARSLGGRLEVRSEPGGGAEVVITCGLGDATGDAA